MGASPSRARSQPGVPSLTSTPRLATRRARSSAARERGRASPSRRRRSNPGAAGAGVAEHGVEDHHVEAAIGGIGQPGGVVGGDHLDARGGLAGEAREPLAGPGRQQGRALEPHHPPARAHRGGGHQRVRTQTQRAVEHRVAGPEPGRLEEGVAGDALPLEESLGPQAAHARVPALLGSVHPEGHVAAQDEQGLHPGGGGHLGEGTGGARLEGQGAPDGRFPGGGQGRGRRAEGSGDGEAHRVSIPLP